MSIHMNHIDETFGYVIETLSNNEDDFNEYSIDKIEEELPRLKSLVSDGMYDGITREEMLSLVIETAIHMTTSQPQLGILASAVQMYEMYKNTPKTFTDYVQLAYEHVNTKTKQHSPLISKEVYDIVFENASTLDQAIQHKRDLRIDIFGLKTLEHSYLLRMNGKVVECPQYMYMRVAIGIHKGDISRALETYNLLSNGYFIHATPTLFHAGTPTPQLSSCFLLTMKSDSIEGIYDTLKTCALISKTAGGIGFSVQNIRSTGSYIRGTNGTSNGIVPLLRVFNNTARYVDQGGGRRKGSFACYIEPWHSDIMDWLELRKNNGTEELRARDLFYAMWTPDLFMHRVKSRGTWTLFCPNEAPGLEDCWGADFEELYERYEKEGRGKQTISAEDLWLSIVKSQIETGMPYMLYKDACNRKSNQQHLGTIRSSNLCAEIVQYSSEDEVAVCNLASLSLPRFVKHNNSTNMLNFDFEYLHQVTRVLTRNLDCIIDNNFYPVEAALRSNFRHRPMGIGVQGLADVFLKLRYPFDSDEAQQLNKDIFETIYHAACTESVQLAQEKGAHETFQGSPMSKGQMQPDMWNVTPSARWDWKSLRADIKQYGMRNSLLVAVMPTASTAQILGNNECVEAYTSNIYMRRVLSGEFPVINRHLIKDLCNMGLWTPELRTQIIANNGSIQNINAIPDNMKKLYRTVWELNQKSILDMAIGRSPYVDQSQSMNIFMASPTINKVTSMHFYGWEHGLKTGLYYLRTRPAATAVQFTVESSHVREQRSEERACEGTDGCQMCSA